MPEPDEHLIRLRGGWLDDGTVPPRRLTLPTRWAAPGPNPRRLTRDFGLPPIDPARQSLWLRVNAAPGLLRVEWNSRDLLPPAPAPPFPWDFPAGPDPPPRHRLMVLVDTAVALGGVGPGAPWGEFALVVRPEGGGEDRGR